MDRYSDSDGMTSVDRWDRVLRALLAEPRRQVVASLIDVPDERRLPLPDAADSGNLSISPQELSIQLRHHHLPVLANAGYVQWADDPFCVQRGRNFEEVEAVVSIIFASTDLLPQELIDGCQTLEAKAHEI